MNDASQRVAAGQRPSSWHVKRTHIVWLCVAILLLALFAQCFYSAWSLGQTIDETFFSGGGYPIVRYNDYKFLGDHPPLMYQLAALPLLFIQPKFPIENPLYVPNTDRIDCARNGALFLYKLGNDPQQILFWERLPLVILTLLLGLGIFLFAREIYGEWGGLLALFLYAFTPDVIGLGSLFMTDMGVTVFYFFTIFALKRFFDKPSVGRAVTTGVACGLAFMSKISSLMLIPVISCLFWVYYATRSPHDPFPGPSNSFQKTIGILALLLLSNALGERQAMILFGPFLLFACYLIGRDLPYISGSRILRIFFRALIVGGAVLCVVYSWRLKKKYGVSASMLLLCGMLVLIGVSSWIARWPSTDNRIRLVKFCLSVFVLAALVIVLGYTDIIYKFPRFIGFGNFTKPLGIVIAHSGRSHGACFSGSFVTCDWRYFFGILAIKTPLLILGLSVLGFVFLLRSKLQPVLKAMLILPGAFFFGAALFNKITIGLRHILPIFPFLFLLCGFSGAVLSNMKRGVLKVLLAGGLAVLLVLFAARSIRTAPDYLVYFNEWIGGVEEGAKLIPVNWGQDNKALAEFVIRKRIPFVTIASESENADVYDYYKIRWRRIEGDGFIDPAPGFYALGIGYYTQQQNDPRSWFKGRQPTYRVGKTFYVFEVPEKQTID